MIWMIKYYSCFDDLIDFIQDIFDEEDILKIYFDFFDYQFECDELNEIKIILVFMERVCKYV